MCVVHQLGVCRSIFLLIRQQSFLRPLVQLTDTCRLLTTRQPFPRTIHHCVLYGRNDLEICGARQWILLLYSLRRSPGCHVTYIQNPKWKREILQEALGFRAVFFIPKKRLWGSVCSHIWQWIEEQRRQRLEREEPPPWCQPEVVSTPRVAIKIESQSKSGKMWSTMLWTNTKL